MVTLTCAEIGCAVDSVLIIYVWQDAWNILKIYSLMLLFLMENQIIDELHVTRVFTACVMWKDLNEQRCFALNSEGQIK